MTLKFLNTPACSKGELYIPYAKNINFFYTVENTYCKLFDD